MVLVLGLATALLGVSYAMFENDVKRLLAFSTISQLGFVLAAPEVGGFYALAHGLAKALLFLTAGSLPSRNLSQLRDQTLSYSLWLPLALGSFSISGLPLLAGYGAKVLAMENLLTWQAIGMNIAACGTAVVFARLILLPHGAIATRKPVAWGGTAAVLVLSGGLLAANGVDYQTYKPLSLLKSLAIIAAGWAAYWLILRRLNLDLPDVLEDFENLLGMMSLALVVLFGMVIL